ncbi:Atg13 [Bugula neritina]|uniref:Atg13 n=1 Tax=Bugula neritina TaxID=10212 RepID=A0A7J7J2F7_BUGNE|nr:Atg13 [Bugula neritina]
MPFAVPTVEHDIGRFYKKFHRKEDLVLLDTGETISETLEQLDLDIYENELKDFDEFCSQLDITVNQGSPV